MATSVQSAGSPIASASAGRKASANLPRTRVVRVAGVSFITDTLDRRDRLVSRDHFDVPHEEYGAGCRTGVVIFGEFMAMLRAHQGDSALSHALDVVKAAVQVLESTQTPPYVVGRFDQRGAAVGFLRYVELALFGAAKILDVDGWVQRELARSDRYAKERDERKRNEKAEFVRRMREGKTRKAAGVQQ
jgi:hypothetical protein